MINPEEGNLEVGRMENWKEKNEKTRDNKKYSKKTALLTDTPAGLHNGHENIDTFQLKRLFWVARKVALPGGLLVSSSGWRSGWIRVKHPAGGETEEQRIK